MEIIDKGKPIKSVVIGTGQISEEHLKFLRDHDDIFLSAVCDLSPATGIPGTVYLIMTHATIDSCINNVLYFVQEVDYETS